MAWKTVTSLDCDTVFALGGVNGKTNKPNPTSIKGYYLGSRSTQVNGEEATIHVFQTPKGNQGIWGSADTRAKLKQVAAGTMTLVEFVEKKKISGGKTKKIFSVSQNTDNTIEVGALPTGQANESYVDEEDETDDELNDLGSPDTNTVAATRAASLSKVQELLNRNKNK